MRERRDTEANHGPVEPPRPLNNTLARWRCPVCLTTCAGFIAFDDRRPRVCRGIPVSGDTQQPCGEIMDEVYRGRA